jgi:hypothetical protein
MTMDYATGYRDGFAAGMAASMSVPPASGVTVIDVEVPRKKRKVSGYAKAYGAAYKRLRRKHTLKSGQLRKGYTHKRLVKLAHAEAKRSKRR